MEKSNFKRNFIKRAVKWAEKQGFMKIKADCEDYETPSQYTSVQKDHTFVPDLTGVKMGKKNYVEVATKTDNVRRVVSKWKLLSSLAAIKGGKLFLLAPKGHKAFTERIVDRYQLNARVVYLTK